MPEKYFFPPKTEKVLSTLPESENQETLRVPLNHHKGKAGFFQSSLWMDYCKKSGTPCRKLSIQHGGKETAGLVVWKEPPALFENQALSTITTKILSIFLPRICWKDGPVLERSALARREEHLTSLISKINPGNVLSGICNFQLANPWNWKGFRVARYGTFFIDCQKTGHELLANLDTSIKKNLKKQSPLVVRELDEPEIKTYYACLAEFRRSRRLGKSHMLSRKFYDHVSAKSFFRHIGAFSGREMVGGLGILGWNDKLMEIGVARKIGHPDESLAQERIKWHVIANAPSWGYRYFDLAGFDPDDNTPKGRNLYRFKKKWGGGRR